MGKCVENHEEFIGKGGGGGTTIKRARHLVFKRLGCPRSEFVEHSCRGEGQGGRGGGQPNHLKLFFAILPEFVGWEAHATFDCRVVLHVSPLRPTSSANSARFYAYSRIAGNPSRLIPEGSHVSSLPAPHPLSRHPQVYQQIYECSRVGTLR